MVNAIILIKAEPKKINAIADQLAQVDTVSEVYSVGGRFDLVAILRCRANEDIASTVTNHVVGMDGILSTETLIAFRAVSKYDMERMFSIGA